ncbi:hypothetical protein [Cohnella sp. WQ 127256]|uniref:hypothetical protein n=1 Tax=Cohnella sp. WQ 127256 TaxID=2938790 RepID=UPI0021196B54|nr:hypothetical protein [Cohnella sp. WQ 127256]
MWIIDEELLQRSTWKELFQKIDSLEGKTIGELNLFDLVFFNSMDNSFVGNGVYVIKENEEIIYIGKASSRPFIERFGGHLDLRTIGGFNNLLKKIVEKKLGKEKNDQTIAEAGRWLMKCKVILVCMEGRTDNSLQFEVLENVLIDKYRYKQLLNKKFKLKYKYDEDRIIRDLVYSNIGEEASIT